MAAHFRAIRFWQDLVRKDRLSTVGADINHESNILELEQLLQDTIRNIREEILVTMSRLYSEEDDNDNDNDWTQEKQGGQGQQESKTIASQYQKRIYATEA